MDKKTIKKRIAREWIYFLGYIFVGFVCALCVAWKVYNLSDSTALRIWVTPYIVCQLIRSILWSFRKLKGSNTNITSKTIAREWLYLLGFSFVGGFIWDVSLFKPVL